MICVESKVRIMEYQKRTLTETLTLSLRRLKKFIKLMIYSTVAFVWCNTVSCSADQSYNFTISYHRPPFYLPRYLQYQLFLYETIIELREKGKTFDQIAQ